MKIHDASRYVNCASRIRCQPNLNAPIFFFSHFRKKERKNFFRGVFKFKKKKFQNFYYRERNIDGGNGKHR